MTLPGLAARSIRPRSRQFRFLGGFFSGSLGLVTLLGQGAAPALAQGPAGAAPTVVQAGAAPAAGVPAGAAPTAASGVGQPRPAPFPPLRLAGTPSTVAGGAWKLGATRGEAVLRRSGAATDEPAQAGMPLGRGDELTTHTGAVEVTLGNGMVVTVFDDSQIGVLGPTTLSLSRAEIQVLARPGIQAQPVYIQCPVGKFPVKARDARIRCDADGTTVAVYEGVARLGGLGPLGVTVLGGLVSRWNRESMPTPPRPLLDSPQWGSSSGQNHELLLSYGPGGVDLGLRWQPVASAQRYRVELYRDGGDAPLTVSSLISQTELAAPRTSAELRSGDVGSYVARVSAIDEFGALGAVSQPRRIVVAQLSGVTPESGGTLRVEPGVPPQLTAPAGQTGAVLIDGEAPSPGAPTPGQHRLRALVGTLSAELTVVVRPKEEPPAPVQSELEPVEAPRPLTAEKPGGTSAEDGKTEPGSDGTAGVITPPRTPSSVAIGPDDTLLGGVGEVPFDGIRSPWAGRLVTLRLESTMSGAIRIGAFGRFTLKNGFGAELGVSALRASLGDFPATASGQGAAGFGNVTAALRSPAVYRRHFGLQAIAGVVAPLSQSALDTSIEVDGHIDGNGTAFRPEVRPGGGGWRIEPAVLIGVRFSMFTLSTTQGASLRVTPTFAPSYAGSLALHADIVTGVRFVTFAAWQLGYLGVPVTPDDSTLDLGAAVGAGIEGLIPAGTLGQLRVALTGRAGVGDAGAAIYGRGTLGLQVGYRFN